MGLFRKIPSVSTAGMVDFRSEKSAAPGRSLKARGMRRSPPARTPRRYGCWPNRTVYCNALLWPPMAHRRQGPFRNVSRSWTDSSRPGSSPARSGTSAAQRSFGVFEIRSMYGLVMLSFLGLLVAAPMAGLLHANHAQGPAHCFIYSLIPGAAAKDPIRKIRREPSPSVPAVSRRSDSPVPLWRDISNPDRQATWRDRLSSISD